MPRELIAGTCDACRAHVPVMLITAQPQPGREAYTLSLCPLCLEREYELYHVPNRQ